MSKFIDLADAVIDYTGVGSEDIQVGIREGLAYLDRFPDRVPGWTITESKFLHAYGLHKGVDGDAHYEGLLRNLGITVVPDPEPTNTEKLKDILYSKGSLSEYQATIFAQHLDAHGVTAPKVKGN